MMNRRSLESSLETLADSIGGIHPLFEAKEIRIFIEEACDTGCQGRTKTPKDVKDSLYQIYLLLSEAQDDDTRSNEELQDYFQKASLFLERRRMTRYRSWRTTFQAIAITLKSSLMLPPGGHNGIVEPPRGGLTSASLLSTTVPDSSLPSAHTEMILTQREDQNLQLIHTQREDQNLQLHSVPIGDNQPTNAGQMNPSIDVIPQTSLDHRFRYHSSDELIEAALSGMLGERHRLLQWCPNSRMIRLASFVRIPGSIEAQMNSLLRYGVIYSSAKALGFSQESLGLRSTEVHPSALGHSIILRDHRGVSRRVVATRSPTVGALQAPGLLPWHMESLRLRGGDFRLYHDDDVYLGPLMADGGAVLDSRSASNQVPDEPMAGSKTLLSTRLLRSPTNILQTCQSRLRHWESLIQTLRDRMSSYGGADAAIPMSLGMIRLGLADVFEKLTDTLTALYYCQMAENDAGLAIGLHNSVVDPSPPNVLCDPDPLHLNRSPWDLYQLSVYCILDHWREDLTMDHAGTLIQVSSHDATISTEQDSITLPLLPPSLDHFQIRSQLIDSYRLARLYRRVKGISIPNPDEEMSIGRLTPYEDTEWTVLTAWNMLESPQAFVSSLLQCRCPPERPIGPKAAIAMLTRLAELLISSTLTHFERIIADELLTGPHMTAFTRVVLPILLHESPELQRSLVKDAMDAFGSFARPNLNRRGAFENETPLQSWLSHWWHDHRPTMDSKLYSGMLIEPVVNETEVSSSDRSCPSPTLESLSWRVDMSGSLLRVIIRPFLLEELEGIHQVQHSLYLLIVALSKIRPDKLMASLRAYKAADGPTMHRTIFLVYRLRHQLITFIRAYADILSNEIAIPLKEKLSQILIAPHDLSIGKWRGLIEQIVGAAMERLRIAFDEDTIWQCLTEAQYATFALHRALDAVQGILASTEAVPDSFHSKVAEYYDELKLIRDSWEMKVETYVASIQGSIATDVVSRHSAILLSPYFE